MIQHFPKTHYTFIDCIFKWFIKEVHLYNRKGRKYTESSHDLIIDVADEKLSFQFFMEKSKKDKIYNFRSSIEIVECYRR